MRTVYICIALAAISFTRVFTISPAEAKPTVKVKFNG